MDRKKQQIILGIDPGTRSTGFGIIKSDGYTFETLDYGCIRPPAKLPLQEKHLVIFRGIESLIEKYLPDAVSIESQFVRLNVQSALKLSMTKAVCTLAATKRGIPTFEYTPKKVKLAVTASGNAEKLQVQKMIKLLLQLKELPTPDDAADGLALAICHINQLNFTQRISP
ncbi:MAG: crossover junction endodeoxyribonuclease RuvC [Simkaniaceae bacterium]|nr:crossover junction endodeoxyribonuclease RuvC [Simkaniaceae bacterium]